MKGERRTAFQILIYGGQIFEALNCFNLQDNAEKERAKTTAFAKSDTFNPLAVGCSVSTKMVMCLHKGEGKGREEGRLLMSGFEIGVEKPNRIRDSLSFS